MSIDVNKIAQLARLLIPTQGCTKLEAQCQATLEMAHNMNRVDTDGVPTYSHTHLGCQPLRDDIADEQCNRDDLLKPAPLVEAHLFAVPKVIEQEET